MNSESKDDDCNFLLKCAELGFSYDDVTVITEFSLNVKKGESICLMGPSGCGKSTFLRLVAGLEKPRSGLLEVPPGHNVFFGFQNYDAFPWLTVEKNISFMRNRGSSLVGLPTGKIIEMVGLRGHEKKFPRQLSGGMLKRLAFGRSIAANAALVLLDEPFSSLDPVSRTDVRELLNRLLIEQDQSAIVVTHDPEEAVFLGSRIIICDGPPLEFLEDIRVDFARPRSASLLDDDAFGKVLNRVRKVLHQLGR